MQKGKGKREKKRALQRVDRELVGLRLLTRRVKVWRAIFRSSVFWLLGCGVTEGPGALNCCRVGQERGKCRFG